MMVLDEKHKKIKDRIDSCNITIKGTKNEIKNLQKECDHPGTIKIDFFIHEDGHITQDAIICYVCGKLISY
jgi:hypothetical protein